MGRFFIALFLFVAAINIGDVGRALREVRDLMQQARDNQKCTLMAVNTPSGVTSICATYQ